MKYVDENRVIHTSKYLDSSDVYNAIKRCNSKILKITYCSLKKYNECMSTESIVIEIIKLHQNCDFIEGIILKNNMPYKDIILRSSSILSIECDNIMNHNDKMSIYDIIKYSDGLIKITQCTKFEKGKCTQKSVFPFLVKSVDKNNKVIKGYRIKNNQPPEYMILSENTVLDVDCITNGNTPDFPWWVIPVLINAGKREIFSL